MIRLHDDIDLGVATHTGQVRSHNEDDYLVLVPGDREFLDAAGRLFVVADGMGGVTGGAEASRAAARALGAEFLSRRGEPAEAVMHAGFAAACRQVFTLSKESPRLADMGTTMTAVILSGSRAVIGHVGDSRCVLARGDNLTQLTEDHAMSEPRNFLTRCIGAGQSSEEVDVDSIEIAVGDRLLLMSDGVWNTMTDLELLAAMGSGSAQSAADRLVEIANSRGAPDNCTALILGVKAAEVGHLREVQLPSEELPQQPHLMRPAGGGLIAPRWPWVVLGLALAVIGMVIVRAWLFR